MKRRKGRGTGRGLALGGLDLTGLWWVWGRLCVHSVLTNDLSCVESVMSPPELPPRNIPLSGPCEAKELPPAAENPRAAEVSRPSLSETLFQRLQSMDTSG